MSQCQQIADIIDRLGRIAHTLQFSDGLNPAQWEALRFLARANRYSRSPGALADYLGTTKGTASQTLIALESKGLVNRSRGRSDRRSIEIRLTDQGRDLVARDPLTLIAEVTAEMPAEERLALAGAMERLVGSLQRARGLPDFGRCVDCAHNCPSAAAEGEEASCLCALTNEMLECHELESICINFEPAA